MAVIDGRRSEPGIPEIMSNFRQRAEIKIYCPATNAGGAFVMFDITVTKRAIRSATAFSARMRPWTGSSLTRTHQVGRRLLMAQHRRGAARAALFPLSESRDGPANFAIVGVARADVVE